MLSSNDKLAIFDSFLVNALSLVGAGVLYFVMLLLLSNTQGIKSLVCTLILLPPLSCILHGYLQPMLQEELYEEVPWFKNNLTIMKFIKDKQNAIGVLMMFALIWLCSTGCRDIDTTLGIAIKDLALSGIVLLSINFIALIMYIVIFFISIDGEIWELGYEDMCRERLDILAQTNNIEIVPESDTQQSQPQTQTNQSANNNQRRFSQRQSQQPVSMEQSATDNQDTEVDNSASEEQPAPTTTVRQRTFGGGMNSSTNTGQTRTFGGGMGQRRTFGGGQSPNEQASDDDAQETQRRSVFLNNQSGGDTQ